jgi:putative ABC transport system substrate-binding protein
LIGLVVALGLALAPLQAEAQQTGKVPRIGVLLTGSPSTVGQTEAFTLGLRELGYVEGQTVAIEYRWGGGRADGFTEGATDLVRIKVDLIVAWGTTAATAARRATSTLPIVLVAAGDPVGTGLVTNLARPGGNVTGLTNISAELSAKLLEILKEVVPGIKRLGVLRNPSNPVSAPQLRWLELAARSLGIEPRVVDVRDPTEFEAAFSSITRNRVDALAVLADPMFLGQRTRLADLAVQSRLPTTFNWRQYAEAGGLIAYGPSLAEQWRRSATYVDKILKGAKPGDLPIEQPTKFELVINLKTAKALGLTIPQTLLLRADQVIE